MAISIVCLWLAFRNVPFQELGRSLSGARYYLLIPSSIALILAIGTRACRWVVLLEGKGRLSDSFWAQSIGYLFTNIMPLRLGEAARVVVMAERSSLPIIQVAGSAVLERLMDVGAVLTLLVLILPFMPVPDFVGRVGVGLGGVALLAVIVLLLGLRYDQAGEKLIRAVTGRVRFLPEESVVARYRELIDGLAPMLKASVVFKAAGFTVLTWIFTIFQYATILWAFKSNATLVEASFMLVTLSLAIAVPSSPGFIGVFQVVGQQALVLPFGAKYDPATALAITLTVHVAYYLLSSVMGVIGLLKIGASFGSLWQSLKSRKNQTATQQGR